MCGVAGLLSWSSRLSAADLQATAAHMADALITRGPDGSGVWVDASSGIALAHRRLSIIDLSPQGQQPMASSNGRYVISFNGEIYNFEELRAQLHETWRGHSDTEVLLACVAAWGVEKTLLKLNGMFAFALWDKEERTLTLARDRMGEKPLYYGWVGDQCVFASELKAFQGLSNWPPEINRDALHLLMRYNYIPAPYSIYTNIYKLRPGYYLRIKAGQMSAEQTPYWSFETMVERSTRYRYVGGKKEAIDQLENLLKYAVKQRMVADVPLGAFLSGGVDSSTLVSLMQAQSARPVKTFTIGFHEPKFDESPFAKAVAKHLGTEHTEIYLSAADTENIIPLLPNIYDEPFADSSQIPTYLVSRFARQHVTVALTGDGGDEIFGGYNRYISGVRIWNAVSVLPLGLRKKLADMLLATRSSFLFRLAPGETFKRRLYKDYEKITATSPEDFYHSMCSLNPHPSRVVNGAQEPAYQKSGMHLGLDFSEWMMLQDAITYFPGDILTKVDRASMSVGLETRTPFTDPEVMAFAWQLPLNMKIHQGKGKWLLRQLLYRYVPQNLIERPKAGFSAPLGDWLRGSLKRWAADLLSTDTLKRQGYFNPATVEKIWQIHQSNRRDMEHQLWSILMFQSWLNKA